MKKKKVLFFTSSFMVLLVISLVGYYVINYVPVTELFSMNKSKNQQGTRITPKTLPNKAVNNQHTEISVTPSIVASSEEKISNENVTGMSKSLSLHISESQQLSGKIVTKNNITTLLLSVLSNDGKPMGIYLSMRPESKSFDLSEVIVDTKIEPFNKPGVYKLQIWAKTVGTVDTKIGEIAVEVLPIINTMIEVNIVKIDTTIYPAIKITFILTDKKGNLIDNINMNQLSVFEKSSLNSLEETKMMIESFETKKESTSGVKLVLTFDSSLSMYNKDKSEKGSLMEKAKLSAIAFIESDMLGANDRVAIASFGKEFTIQQGFTNDKSKLIKAIKNIKSRPDTAIFDAVVKSIKMFNKQSELSSLIIFTDGEDNSSKLTYKEAISVAKELKVPVFTIALGERAKTNEFKSISDKTDGEFYYLKDPKLISTSYDRITRSIRNQYIVTYKSTTSETIEYRVLKLLVNHESGAGSAQKSYKR